MQLGKEVECKMEPSNVKACAAAVIKEGNVVGHLP